jgi:hypothetical protein
MKPIVKQILMGTLGCAVLILIFSFGLSLVVNDALAKFEAQGNELLPSGGENPSENPTP